MNAHDKMYVSVCIYNLIILYLFLLEFYYMITALSEIHRMEK